MPRAYIKIKNSELYPFEAVCEGAKALGFRIEVKYEPNRASPDDIVISWTLWRHMRKRMVANHHQQLGGKVICMENGWIRNIHDKRYFQFALRNGDATGINGSGVYPVGNAHRWDSWDISLKPWRVKGDHILVCPQRGVRPQDPDITHGEEWIHEIYKKIRKQTQRKIMWRGHPGAPNKVILPKGYKNDENFIVSDPKEPIQNALKGAHCCVVYSSTSANEALIEGIPVIYDGENIICRSLAGRVDKLEKPPMRNREKVFGKLAYAQWNEEELATGEPLKRLL